MSWQPIPENPKDGDKILAVSKGRKEAVWFYWDTQPYHKKPKPFWHCHGYGSVGSKQYPPTAHFVLPDPPEGTT